MRWEVLFKLTSGWTCILVPAYGIAWVSPSSVIMEREKPSRITGDDPLQSSASLKALSWASARPEHVLHLLSTIGHSLESLSLSLYIYSSERLEAILVKHLELPGTDSASVLLLQRAYQEGRCKIERLSISLDTEAQQGNMSEVALLLGDS